jgi:SAM-dependent methyltransferase
VCSGGIRPWARKRSAQGDFRIDRCGSCRFAFVNPRPDKHELAAYYTRKAGDGPHAAAEDFLRAEKHYPNAGLDAHRIVSTIARLRPPGPRFLDVGCGAGFFSREAVLHGFTVTAIEPDPAYRGVTTVLAGIEPLETTFEAFQGGSPFHCVLMSQVLEHAADVGEWVARAGELLAPSGILAVAVPNFDSLFRLVLGKRDPFVSPPEHLNFFASPSLGRLAARSGFSVVQKNWVSRLPSDVVSKRLGFPRALIPLLKTATGLGVALYSRLVDRIGFGTMLHVYCRKAFHGKRRV